MSGLAQIIRNNSDLADATHVSNGLPLVAFCRLYNILHFVTDFNY